MHSGYGGYGTSQVPLAGAILCCTSISPEQRTELGVIGAQMGALIKLDLTSDVTHLVVGNVNSAKYRYVAKSRDDVKVLDPGWLKALRNVWMEGADVDVAALEEQYRLPTFYGLKICLTGFDDPEQRKYIQETVSKNGGEYHGDLTKNVTHLIAALPSGKKYDHAVNWGLRIVTWEWFQQSVDRGMVLGEEYFDPKMEPAERGKGAWERRQSASPALGKRVRETAPSDLASSLRRKLRRSASTRFGSQSDALWAGITAGGLEHQRKKADEWTIAEPVPSPEQTTPTAQAPEVTHVDQDTTPDPASRIRKPFLDDEDEIFASRLIFPHGFDAEKTKILLRHLEGNGAVTVRESSQLSNFTSDDIIRGFAVVPHDISADLITLPEGAGKLSLVTNWWVERCIHRKRLIDPTENVLCRPFNKLKINGFHNLTINLTGFSGIELLQVTKAVPLFGAIHDDFLSEKITLMVCNTHKPNPDKLKFATEKGIPAVHATWLWESISSGYAQSYDAYLLNPKVPQAPKTKHNPRASLPEVPTALLSEEDSLKLRTKIRNAKPVSKTRDASKRPGALELSLSGHPTPTSATDSSNDINVNTNHVDGNNSGQLHMNYDGINSIPLQDLNPSVNSPRRPSTSSTHHTDDADVPTKPAPAPHKARRAQEPTPDSFTINEDSMQPPPIVDENKPQETNYSDMMSKLLANRKTSSIVDNEEEKGRRKRRPLGRAPSARSSAASTADEPSSKTNPAEDNDTTIVDEQMNEEIHESLEAEQPFKITQASQELGWDSPGAQRARENMIIAMGGKIKEKNGAVEEAATVKDKPEDVGIGARTTRRRRG